MSVACDVDIKEEIKEEPLNFDENSKDGQLPNNKASDLGKSQCSADPIEAIYLQENIKEEKLDAEVEEEEQKQPQTQASNFRSELREYYLKKMERQTIDSEILIDQIRARPAIWDMSSKEYNDKNLKKKIWEELATMFSGENATQEEKKLIESALQKKWKNLRDVYVRDMKKIKNLKSDSTATSKSTSAHFQRLTFLQPTVQKRTADNSFQVEDDSNNNVSKTSDENCDYFKSPIDKPPAKKCKLHPAGAYFAKILEKGIEQKKEEDDEDKLFCLSLFKEIKKVPENGRLRLKIEIYDLVERHQMQTNIQELFSRPFRNISSSRNCPSTSHIPHDNNDSNHPHSQSGYTTDTSDNTNANSTCISPINSPSTSSPISHEGSEEFELLD